MSVLSALWSPLDPAHAQIEGASYTLQPTYNVLRWGKDVGLEDTELLGGRLGLNLGRYVSLQGYYLGRNDVDTRLGDAEDLPNPGAPFGEQEINLSLYGADVLFNFNPNNNVVPFVKLGGGILRLDPTIGDESEHIAVKAGAGIRFGIARLQGELFAEDVAFRLNRYRLAPYEVGSEIPSDPDDDKLRHNLSIGMGVNFNLGGHTGRNLTETDRAIADRLQSGLSGMSLPLEPFVGRMDFSDKMALDTQDLFGLRTGMDFGPFFGVRGYYWRGVNDDWDETVGLQSYGGEAQFNLNAGAGAVPFLIAGVGKLDFRDEFTDPAGNERDDETILILGGGLGLNLTDRLQLDLAARDYVVSNEDLEDVATTDELSSNWMITAGLTFSLFGNPPSRDVLLADDSDRDLPDDIRIRGDRDRIRDRREARARRIREHIRERRGDAWDQDDWDLSPGDEGDLDREKRLHERIDRSLRRRGIRREQPWNRGMSADEPRPVRNYQGDQVVTLPVPEEGELYVRYGKPGGVEIESRSGGGPGTAPGGHWMMLGPDGGWTPGLAPPAPPSGGPPEMMTPPSGGPPETAPPARDMNRRDAPPVPVNPPAWDGDAAERRTDERLDRLERLLSDRLDRMEERLNDRNAESPRTDVDRDRISDDDDDDDDDVLDRRGSNGPDWNPKSLRVYTGLNVDEPNQAVFGARLNLGPVSRNSDFSFMPELALGFGDGATSFLVAGNLYYDFPPIGDRQTFSPFVGAGLGLLRFGDNEDGDDDEVDHSGTEAVLNLGYGLTADFGRYTAFAEHQGVDLFDLNRILIGLRLSLD